MDVIYSNSAGIFIIALSISCALGHRIAEEQQLRRRKQSRFLFPQTGSGNGFVIWQILSEIVFVKFQNCDASAIGAFVNGIKYRIYSGTFLSLFDKIHAEVPAVFTVDSVDISVSAGSSVYLFNIGIVQSFCHLPSLLFFHSSALPVQIIHAFIILLLIVFFTIGSVSQVLLRMQEAALLLLLRLSSDGYFRALFHYDFPVFILPLLYTAKGNILHEGTLFSVRRKDRE